MKPSFLAIFCKPSSVEVNVFWREASTAQSAVGSTVDEGRDRLIAVKEVDIEVEVGPAMQNWELLFTQKTSLQQDVIPRFCGKPVNFGFELDRVVFGDFGTDG